jgi:hypothetical protein
LTEARTDIALTATLYRGRHEYADRPRTDTLMSPLKSYLTGLGRIRATGGAVEETSYYGQLEALLNTVGESLSPKVLCVLTTRNLGEGIPDGGLFLASSAVEEAGSAALLSRAPERGAMEVKGAGVRTSPV